MKNTFVIGLFAMLALCARVSPRGRADSLLVSMVASISGAAPTGSFALTREGPDPITESGP